MPVCSQSLSAVVGCRRPSVLRSGTPASLDMPNFAVICTKVFSKSAIVYFSRSDLSFLLHKSVWFVKLVRVVFWCHEAGLKGYGRNFRFDQVSVSQQWVQVNPHQNVEEKRKSRRISVEEKKLNSPSKASGSPLFSDING